MTSPRAALVSILRDPVDGVPTTWDVRDYDTDDLGNIKRTTVTVRMTSLGGIIAQGTWQAGVVVDVVAPQERYEHAEPVLEAALDTMLSTLRTAPATRSRIDGAQRIVRGERHHAWRINLSVPCKEE